MRPLGVLLAAFVAAALSGCQTVPQRVLVPVAMPCQAEKPRPPVWATDTLQADAGIFDQVKALLAERLQRIGYQSELEAVVDTCTSAPNPAALNR